MGNLMNAKLAAAMLYNTVCRRLSMAKPIRADWDFKSYDMISGSINTPGVEIGGGYSGGTLVVQDQCKARPNKLKCITGDLAVGLGPSPINASFPLPTMPSTGIIYKLPIDGTQNMEITENSFRGGFFSISNSAQMGPSAGIVFLMFLPRYFPKFEDITPSIIWNAGVFIAIAGTGGGLCPDWGVTASLGCAV